jgi:hypothetical protein
MFFTPFVNMIIWLNLIVKAIGTSKRMRVLDNCRDEAKKAMEAFKGDGNNLCYAQTANLLAKCLFERLYLAPTWKEKRAFAHEGKIFIINSCGIADEQNIAVCCDTQEEKENIIVNSGGGSSIIGPNGEFLAGLQELKHELGLHCHEGRSWTSWRRYFLLVFFTVGYVRCMHPLKGTH